MPFIEGYEGADLRHGCKVLIGFIAEHDKNASFKRKNTKVIIN